MKSAILRTANFVNYTRLYSNMCGYAMCGSTFLQHKNKQISILNKNAFLIVLRRFLIIKRCFSCYVAEMQYL